MGFFRAIFTVFVVAAFPVAETQASKPSKRDEAPIAGELILRVSPGLKSTKALEARLERSLASAVKRTLRAGEVALRPLQSDASFQVLRFPASIDVKEASRIVAADGEVRYAEPNHRVHLLGNAIPNDEDFAKLWGIRNTGQADSSGQAGLPGSDIGVTSLWGRGITGKRSVLVGVIDTGISWTHPDLVENLYTNPGEAGELATNGVDDDGNGFIDDVHGWNFHAKSNDSRDDHNHGTHCAGTIGGVANNGRGVAGVNWQVTLLPIKFLSAEGGGSLADAVDAVLYGVKMKANVLSNSWGGGPASQALLDAIRIAKDAGVLFVAAAGNSKQNNDATPTYPANYDVENVVSVAAIDNRDQLASFSNFGARKVHVAAPGVRVYSTVAKGDGYDTYSGTSMATPHVAGIAGLLWSTELGEGGKRAFALIKERLIATSAPVRWLGKKVLAKGRVNAENAYLGVVPPREEEPDPRLWRSVEKGAESPHPAGHSQTLRYEIRVPGAKKIRAHFAKIETEACCDLIRVRDSNGIELETLGGKLSGHLSEYADGDTLVVELKTDSSIESWGFSVDRVQVIE